MYVHALAYTYTQLSGWIQSAQPRMFSAAQLNTFINRKRSMQRNWVHSSIVYVQRSAIEYILHSTTEYAPQILSH